MPEKLCGNWHHFTVALSSTCCGEINVSLVTNICFLTCATLKIRPADCISASKKLSQLIQQSRSDKFTPIAEANNRLLNKLTRRNQDHHSMSRNHNTRDKPTGCCYSSLPFQLRRIPKHKNYVPRVSV